MNANIWVPQVEVRELAVAWEWVLRLRTDDASQEDLAEWLQWYEADESHKQAFEEMQALWRGAAGISEGPRGLTISQLLGPSETITSSPPLGSFFESLKAWRRTLVWTGASLAVVACAFVLGLNWMAERQSTITASSGPSVVREARLPDGSSVELAARSAVAVRYSETERLVDMKAGEAYFSVAHNIERPFIVKVGQLRVRAVGTAFNVRRADDRVVVTVTKGAVDIYSTQRTRSGDELAVMRVKSGNQAIWNESEPKSTIAVIDTDHVLAWRQGRLEYLNEPLSAVIADVNRYSKHPVVIKDEAVGKILFSGTVFTDATDIWLHALPSVFPVDIQQQSAGNSLILSRSSSSEAAHTSSQ